MRRCPVCHRRVQPTKAHNIQGHVDTSGKRVCPASGEPFDITEAVSKDGVRP
jgi:hypothetical protein